MTADFVSLLTSGYHASAEQTMSADLKKVIPPGSFAYDKWANMPPPSEKKTSLAEAAARGARHASLAKSASELLDAAARLADDVRRETVYWAQVLRVKERGWTVARMQGHGRGELCVQVASREAIPMFQRKGLAAFRPDERGRLGLGEQDGDTKALRVRVLRNGKVTGVSKVAAATMADPDSEYYLADLVAQARDALFEEEAFHEMVLESRQLLSFDVTYRNGVLHFPFTPQSCEVDESDEILIDLVSEDSVLDALDTSDDDIAQNVGQCGRLLLCHLHRERYARRTALQRPLTEEEKSDPPTAVAQPLLATFQQIYAVRLVRNVLENFMKALHNAGMDVTLEQTEQSIFTPSKNLPASTPQTTYTLTLPSSSLLSADKRPPKSVFEIGMLTDLKRGPFGTGFSLVIPSTLTPILYSDELAQPKTLQFTSLFHLLEQLCHAVAVDLVHNVIRPLFPETKGEWRAEPGEALLSGTVLLRSEEDKPGEGIEKDVDIMVEVRAVKGQHIVVRMGCDLLLEEVSDWRSSSEKKGKTLVERVAVWTGSWT
jgi:mediator of RNA polymerase II transcription subunit 17